MILFLQISLFWTWVEGAPVILGRPFLNIINAIIYVGSGQVHFQLQGRRVKCPFIGYIETTEKLKAQAQTIHNVGGSKKTRRSRKQKKSPKPQSEQCSMITIKFGPGTQNIREVEIQPPIVKHLYKEKPEPLKKAAPKKITPVPPIDPP